MRLQVLSQNMQLNNQKNIVSILKLLRCEAFIEVIFIKKHTDFQTKKKFSLLDDTR